MNIRAGEVDWIARYAEMVAASEARVAPRPDDRWRGRAARFDRMSRRERGVATGIEGLVTLVRPSDVVIDVGAGTGRHAVPLAARCARVIAMEPSDSMRARLEARLAEEAITNVEVRGSAWPDAAAPIGDIVISAHVVYGVADIAPFLEAMTAHARCTCVLLLKLRAPADTLATVAEALHGVIRPRRPGALEALAVLHQLGHAAELNFVDGTARPMEFSDTEEDLREVASRVGLATEAADIARVREALDRVATRTADGWYIGDAGPTARLTWSGSVRAD